MWHLCQQWLAHILWLIYKVHHWHLTRHLMHMLFILWIRYFVLCILLISLVFYLNPNPLHMLTSFRILILFMCNINHCSVRLGILFWYWHFQPQMIYQQSSFYSNLFHLWQLYLELRGQGLLFLNSLKLFELIIRFHLRNTSELRNYTKIQAY